MLKSNQSNTKKRMLKNILPTLILLLCSFSLSAQVDTIKLREKIKILDLAHAAAIFKGDVVALDSLMDDNVTVNHPTNRIVKEKKELLELIRQGVIRYTSFERFPEKFLFFDNMVIVMGSEIVVPAMGAPGAKKTLHRRYTNLWMKQDQQWRLTVRHANNICQ